MYYGGQLYNRSYVAYWHTFSFFFIQTGKSYLIIVRVYTTIAISGLKGHSLLIIGLPYPLQNTDTQNWDRCHRLSKDVVGGFLVSLKCLRIHLLHSRYGTPRPPMPAP